MGQGTVPHSHAAATGRTNTYTHVHTAGRWAVQNPTGESQHDDAEVGHGETETLNETRPERKYAPALRFPLP